MTPGKIQQLSILEKIDSGIILTDDTGDRAFMSNVFVKPEWQIGDEIEAFIFQDDGKLKATTEKPYAQVNEFAVLSCVQTLPMGSFVDWGIIKDLFIPYKEQKGKMIEGKRYLIYIYLDEKTGLLTGTAKFKRNPTYPNFPLQKGEKVSLILMNETNLGWNVIINQKYIGLLYSSDVYKKIYPLSLCEIRMLKIEKSK